MAVVDDWERGLQAGAGPPDGKGRHALLLLNRKARNGASPIDAALIVLERHGITVTERSSEGSAALASAIREGRHLYDLVIVGGGDGTLNCAAPAILETGLPLGILPLGTANDLARTLGIAPDPVAAAETIGAGQMRNIDLGEVNGRYFFNVASIGFSAELARELTAEAKRRWGTLGYAFASARLLLRTHAFTASIEHDGLVHNVKTVQISIGNGRHYGGGLTMDANAKVDDGRFHVYSLEVDRWWRLLALAPALKRGTHGAWRDVRAFTTTEVTVRTRRRRSVNTDGELTTATPATFRLRRAAIRVFAPAREEAAP